MKGKIYRLYNSECCYIGATKRDIQVRFNEHRGDYNRWSKGKELWVSSFILYESNEEVNIELLEEIDFEYKKELHKLEQSYIDKYRDTAVNVLNPGTDNKEYKSHWNKTNKEWKHQWYLDNKERICKQILCDCGGRYKMKHKNTHLKSKKHIDYCNPLKTDLHHLTSDGQ